MAQKILVSMSDDITGEPAVETLQFGLDGVSYEIDLSEDNAIDLRDMLYRYTEAGRRTSGRKTRRALTAPGELLADRRAHTQELRTWARGNGFAIAERGRVSAEVAEAFAAAKASAAEEVEVSAKKNAPRKKTAAASAPKRRARNAAAARK